MKFWELFKKAMDSVAENEEYAGRRCAIDAFMDELKPLLDEQVKDSKWESIYASNPYGNQDPYIMLNAHGVSYYIHFKVKVKKVGQKHTWGGKVILYHPVGAVTIDESIMDEEIVPFINALYDRNDSIKVKIAEEDALEVLKVKYKDLIESYNNTVKELNNLPKEDKNLLLRLDWPYLYLH